MLISILMVSTMGSMIFKAQGFFHFEDKILSMIFGHKAQKNIYFERNYSFTNNMPENVLRSYLSRSITVSGILFDSISYDGVALYPEDDERMVINVGAKFIGRSIFMWGDDRNIINPLFLSEAKTKIDRMHQIDPDIIFQACIFEIVTPSLAEVPVPE